MQYGPIQRQRSDIFDMPLALRGSGPDPAQMGVQEQITSGDLDGAGADELVGNGVGELVIVGSR